MRSPRTLLLALALAWLTSGCLPEAQLARLLDRHPGLLNQLTGPGVLRDSIAVRVRDSTMTLHSGGKLWQVVVPVRELTRYRTQTTTVVLDNARARRQLAEAESKNRILAGQLRASQQEVARLHGLAYPQWYNTIWFWVALLLLVLLGGSVVLRFARFSILPF